MRTRNSFCQRAALVLFALGAALSSLAVAKPAEVTALWHDAAHLDLFKTTPSGEVQSTWWESGCGWQPWFAIYPEVKMQPGAKVSALWRSNHTHLDLFVSGSDGAVWSTWWEPGRDWQRWFVIHP
jgi:hypothetical protein